MRPDDDVEFAHDFITALHQNHENAENLRQNLMAQSPMDGALTAANLFQNLATDLATLVPEDQNTPLRAIGGLFENLSAMLQNPDLDGDEMASRVDTLRAPFSDEPPPECNIS